MDSVPSLELSVGGEGDNKALMGGRLLIGLSIARWSSALAPSAEDGGKDLCQQSNVFAGRLARFAEAMSGRE